MKIIRVLHIFMGEMTFGGIEQIVMDIYRNIDKDTIQFDFMFHSNNTGVFSKEIEELGGKIYLQPTKKNLFKCYRSMKKIFINNNYDIVHIHTTYAITYIDALVAKKSGVKNIIIHSHNNSANLKKKIIHYLLRNNQKKLATTKLSCSSLASKWMFKDDSAFVIKNAIDINKFSYNEETRNNIRKELNLSNKFILGNVARFSYQKNHKYLLKIFEEYRKINVNAHLLLIGSGEDLPKIKKLISKNNINESVTILPPKSDIQNYMMAMDIFLLPSRYEGLGIVAVEAQALGMNVIITDMAPKEVKLTNNLVFQSVKKNVNRWCESIEKMRLSKGDNNVYEKIINSGYIIEETVKEISNMYIEMGEKENE